MMWLCKPSLCAAVSNAGGMGNLTAGNYTTEEEFRDAIQETRRLTHKPFMVNITLLPSIRLTRSITAFIQSLRRRKSVGN